MKTKTKEKSPALEFVSLCWDAIPRRSWRNRNSAMHQALVTAIESGMPFDPDDMLTISREFKAGWWTGDGEGVYTRACSADSGANIPAAIAIEKWLGRPAVLWAERTKYAERLHVGSEFNWQGHYVKVTSMRADCLIACTYKSERGDNDDKYAVGRMTYSFGEHRRIEAFTKMEDGTIMARLSPQALDESSSIAKRFTISYAKLADARKTYDARRRGYEKAIAAATTLADLEPVKTMFAADGRDAFRHWDVELIRAAFNEANRRIREAMDPAELEALDREQRELRKATAAADLKRWMAGDSVDRYFEVVRLRVKGAWVETSTQQKATIAGVRKALAFVKRYRKSGWTANGASFDLDQYPLKSITKDGVKVGCTFVEWSEIDRIAPQLSKHSQPSTP